MIKLVERNREKGECRWERGRRGDPNDCSIRTECRLKSAEGRKNY